MSKWWLLLTTLAVEGAFSQEAPWSSGEVKLPLANFEGIWKELNKSSQTPVDKAPPVGAVLSSANLVVRAGDEGIRVRSSFEVRILEDRWNTVPVLPPSYAVLSTEPSEALFAVRDGLFSFLSNKAGKQVVTVESVIEAERWQEGHPVEIVMPDAASVTFEIPSGENSFQALVAGGVALASGKYAAQPKSTIQVRFIRQASAEKPDVASKWRASREVFARFEEDQVIMTARVALELEEGTGTNASLLLPAAVRIVNVTSDELLERHIEHLNDKQNKLSMRWFGSNPIRREVIVETSMPPPMEGSKWQLQAPMLEGEENVSSWFAVALPEDFDATIEGETGDSSRAEPGLWLQRLANGVTKRFAVGKPSLTVTIKTPPVVAIPRVTCPLLESQSRLVSDGALVTDLRYSLRHEAGAAVRIKLPEHAVLLSCIASKRSVDPVLENDGSIRVRLGNKADDTKLEISYHQKQQQWDPLRGRFEVRLPLASLMIEKVDWKLMLPGGYEMEAFEGNVGSIAADGKVTFQKLLCNEEAPFVELFYKKEDLRN